MGGSASGAWCQCPARLSIMIEMLCMPVSLD
jgi:hypothetical protein